MPVDTDEFNRQALHAYQLGLVHPRTGDYMNWQVELPQDMQHLLSTMGVDDLPLPEPDMEMDAVERLG